MKPMVFFYLILSLCSTKSFAFHNGSSVVTVGGDSNCDFNSGSKRIQEAINSGVDEIRIASNSIYVEKIVLDNQSVIIRGGFSDCDAADQNNQVDIKALINGDTGLNGPVIKITGLQEQSQIRLENLELTGGTGSSAFLPGSGIFTSLANADLELFNMHIHNNTAASGGGIYSQAGVVEILLYDTIIENNTANSGGGLACFGSNSVIGIYGESRIADNIATTGLFGEGNGGGMFLTQGCRSYLGAGDATNGSGFDDIISIQNNHAETTGGGVFVSDGSSLTAISYGSQPVFIRDNSAVSNGGGVFVSGEMSLASLLGVYIIQNISDHNGGGVAVADGAYLKISDNLAVDQGCSFDPSFTSMGCNLFSGNTSVSTGGAIHNAGGRVSVYKTYFTKNRSTFATTISNYSGGETTVESSVFARNGLNGEGDDGHHDLYLMNLTIGSTLTAVNSTFVDNEVVGAIFTAGDSPGNEFSIFLSIVHNQSGLEVPVIGNAAHQNYFECVLVHETISLLEANTFRIIDENPMFTDRKNQNYHLSMGSPAIDFCDVRPSHINGLDIDGDDFGWNDPNTVNQFGVIDLGADEYFIIDHIFENSFESLN